MVSNVANGPNSQDVEVMPHVDADIRRMLLESLEMMPVVIRSGLLEKKRQNATTALGWTERAVRVHRGQIGRPLTDTDRHNAAEARQILKQAVPLLEKVHNEHKSERLRRKAGYYLEIIAAELGSN
jgi:hypothetical protein